MREAKFPKIAAFIGKSTKDDDKICYYNFGLSWRVWLFMVHMW